MEPILFGGDGVNRKVLHSSSPLQLRIAWGWGLGGACKQKSFVGISREVPSVT